jgi:hypothetical protein
VEITEAIIQPLDVSRHAHGRMVLAGPPALSGSVAAVAQHGAARFMVTSMSVRDSVRLRSFARIYMTELGEM